ncbi:MAG: phosphate/phosphite/phosphonate ABC transporter substrate-binding protein [Prochloraceae cyanobacterium]
MLSKLLRQVAFASILATLASCSSQSKTNSISQSSTNPKVTQAIVIADTNTNPQRIVKQYQPLADYLAANLSQFNIGRGRVKVASDWETIAEWLKSGEVDVYFDSVYAVMRVVDVSGAKPILRRWKKGSGDYYTVFFAMSDRGINSLSNLKGKIIALDNPSSTSGYFLPVTYLIESGLNPVEKTSVSAPVSAEQVGYIFTNDDDNTIEWTIGGKVAAAATDNGNFEKIPEKIRQSMLILEKTETLPRGLAVVRADMEPEMVEAIKTLLLKMDRTPEGQAILEQFQKTTKFDEFPVEGLLSRMRELYAKIKQHELER